MTLFSLDVKVSPSSEYDDQYTLIRRFDSLKSRKNVPGPLVSNFCVLIDVH